MANEKNEEKLLPINIALNTENAAFTKLLRFTYNLPSILPLKQQKKILMFAIEQQNLELLNSMLPVDAIADSSFVVSILEKAFDSTTEVFDKIQANPSFVIQGLKPGTQKDLLMLFFHRYMQNDLQPHKKLLFQKIIEKCSLNVRKAMLFQAVELHNETLARIILRCGARYNAPWNSNHSDDCSFCCVMNLNYNSDGITPLTKAIKFNNLITVRQLLEKGASPNCYNKGGSYPIHSLASVQYQTKEQFSELLQLLLNHGANIDQRNRDGDTLLHLVCNNSDLVQILLLYKAKLIGNKKLLFPHQIHKACIYLRAYADPILLFDNFKKAPNDNQEHTLMQFVRNHPEKVKSFSGNGTWLHFACRRGMLQLVKLLLEIGINVNVQDEKGNFPQAYSNDTSTSKLLKLFEYDKIGKTTLCKLWIEKHNCNEFTAMVLSPMVVNMRNKDGSTLTHHIAMKDNKCYCIDRVLDANPNFELQDHLGNTALHKAVESENTEALKKFIDSLTKINGERVLDIQNSQGKTSLHMASEIGSLKHVKFLVDHKASIYVRDKQGKLPLAYFIEIHSQDDVNEYTNSEDMSSDDSKESEPQSVMKIEQESNIELTKADIIKLLSPTEEMNTKFVDLVGHLFAKEQLRAIIDIFEKPVQTRLYNVKIPKTILFEGPPGVGKTMLARAFKNELAALKPDRKWRFKQIYCAEFNSSKPGQGASNIKEVFKKAYKKSPCILFLDEVDSIAGIDRSNTRGEAGNESKRVLNCLLEQISKYEKKKKTVILIAATNLASSLDSAFLDRFHERIAFEYPSYDERESILQYLFNRIPVLNITGDVGKQLAELTEGFSIRQLKSIVENSCRNAFRSNTPPNNNHLLKAFSEIAKTNNSNKLI